MHGPTEPRLASPTVKGLRAAVDLAKWSKTNIDVDLFPWQAHVAKRFLGQTGGRFHYRQALVTCARQNGKTTLFEPLIAWRMTSYADTHGPQVVVLIGSNRRQSIPIFRRIARLFETHFADRVHKVRHGAGTTAVDGVDGGDGELVVDDGVPRTRAPPNPRPGPR